MLDFLCTPIKMMPIQPHIEKLETLSDEYTASYVWMTRERAQQQMSLMLQSHRPLRSWFPNLLLQIWDEIYSTHLSPVFDFCGQSSLTENGTTWKKTFQTYASHILQATLDFFKTSPPPNFTPDAQIIYDDFINKLQWFLSAYILKGRNGYNFRCPLLGVPWMVDIVKKFSIHEFALAEVSIIPINEYFTKHDFYRLPTGLNLILGLLLINGLMPCGKTLGMVSNSICISFTIWI
jgi:hypothetical protein